MNAVLSNGILTATFSAVGAELIGLEKDGRNVIWEGDPAVWGFHAPVLFPICGGLKDDRFLYRGKEYTLQKHGFVRRSEFAIESKSENGIVFLHRSNEETLKQYPFPYEFRVIYTLDGSSLRVGYSVKNPSDDELYFSVGAHEAYACPEGIEEYSVLFETPETLDATQLDGNLLAHTTVNYGRGVTELPLKYDYFAVDALVFREIRSRSVTLLHRASGRSIGLDFPGHDTFLLWTKPGAKYICLEPWCGCPNYVDGGEKLEERERILRLAGGARITKPHVIRL